MSNGKSSLRKVCLAEQVGIFAPLHYLAVFAEPMARRSGGAVGNNVTTTAANTIVVGNHTKDNTHTFGQNSVSLGFDAVAQETDSVALGSTSVAKRKNRNGGGANDLTNTGFDVTTGTNYAGEDKTDPTWLSTLGAVSVGGTEKDTDANIGTAATQTRQITGVAAGTADTDAGNVAQLRLAKLKTVVTSSDNSVTITAPEGEKLGEPNADGVITFDLSVKAAGGADGDTTYTYNDTTETAQKKDPTIVQQTTVIQNNPDGSTETVATINDTNTTYDLSKKAGDEGSNIVNNYTVTGTDGKSYSFEDTDTNTHAIVVGKGAVTVNRIKEPTETEGPTYEVSLNTELLGDTTYTAEQSVTAGEKPGEGSTTFNITDSNGDDAGSMTIQAGDNITITEKKRRRQEYRCYQRTRHDLQD